jgi:hypothetical protein
MSDHENGIIREAAAACQMAEIHGCNIDVHIRRWGHLTTVKVTPLGGAEVKVDDQPTMILPPKDGVMKEET